MATETRAGDLGDPPKMYFARLLGLGNDLRLGRLGLRHRGRSLRLALDSLFEAAQSFAQSLAQLRQFARTKNKESDDENEEQMGRCKQIIKHVGMPAS